MTRTGRFTVLKGAVLFVVWSDRPHRATKDLDLLGRGTPDATRLAGVFRDVCLHTAPEDGVTFAADTIRAEPIREEAVYDGIRLRFRAHLGTAEIPVQVDVGFGDTTVPEPYETELPVLLDFPAPKLKVYARESTRPPPLRKLANPSASRRSSPASATRCASRFGSPHPIARRYSAKPLTSRRAS